MSNKSVETSPKGSKRRSSVLYLRLAVACIVLVIVGVLLGQNKTISHAFYLATTKQPERFTELYFNNSINLPTQITATKIYSFSFHVTNHEAETESYAAYVTILQNGHPSQLQITKFTLPDGAGQDVTVHFTTPKAGTALELIVSLPANAESIDFRSKS
jgi:uncharacterized membrane protein